MGAKRHFQSAMPPMLRAATVPSQIDSSFKASSTQSFIQSSWATIQNKPYTLAGLLGVLVFVVLYKSKPKFVTKTSQNPTDEPKRSTLRMSIASSGVMFAFLFAYGKLNKN